MSDSKRAPARVPITIFPSVSRKVFGWAAPGLVTAIVLGGRAWADRFGLTGTPSQTSLNLCLFSLSMLIALWAMARRIVRTGRPSWLAIPYFGVCVGTAIWIWAAPLAVVRFSVVVIALLILPLCIVKDKAIEGRIEGEEKGPSGSKRSAT